MSRNWYLHPLLFALYPALSQFAFNAAENAILYGARVLLISLLIGANVLGLSWLAVLSPVYVWLGLGQAPWTHFVIQAARFGGGCVFPGANILASLRPVASGSAVITDVLDLLFLFALVALAIAVWRRQPRLYPAYYLSLFFLYLTRQGGSEPQVGMVRYVPALFPAFFIVREVDKQKWVNRLFLYGGWAGLRFMSGGSPTGCGRGRGS